MSNPLTEKQTVQQNAPDLNKLYQQFRKNPLEWLLKSRLNVPQEFSDSPRAMVEHLMKTGQVPPQLIPQIRQMMSQK